jgi:hypothetical protein
VREQAATKRRVRILSGTKPNFILHKSSFNFQYGGQRLAPPTG